MLVHSHASFLSSSCNRCLCTCCCAVLSHTHTMGRVGRHHSGSLGPTSPCRLGHPTPHCTGLHPDDSRGRLHNLSVQELFRLKFYEIYQGSLPLVQTVLVVWCTFLSLAMIWGLGLNIYVVWDKDAFLPFRTGINDSAFYHLMDDLSYCTWAVAGLFHGCMGSRSHSCEAFLCITRVPFRGHHWLPWSLRWCLCLLLTRLVTPLKYISVFFCSKYFGCSSLLHIIYRVQIIAIKFTL